MAACTAHNAQKAAEEHQRTIAVLTAQLRDAGIEPAAGSAAGHEAVNINYVGPPQPLQWNPAAYCASGGRLTRDYALGLVEEYGAAWMAQDEERITQIFTEDARYLEHPYDPKRVYAGRAGIRDYWVRQIQGKQKGIVFRQMQDALLLDPERHTVLAKWEAEFLNLQRDGSTYLPVMFVQVAMLTIDVKTGLISSLEEYWTSKGKYGKGERMGAMDDNGKVWKNRRAIIRANKKKLPKLQAGGMWMGAYAMR